MLTKPRHGFGTRLALILVLLIVEVIGAIPAKPVHAATFTVTNTNDIGVGSLRQAIFDAPSGSTITFAPSLAGQTILLASDLIINKDLTIDGSGLSPQIIISGGNIAHLILQVSMIPPIVTISDLTISDGYTSGNGGGINASSGNLTLINTTLRNNHALGSGGAVSATWLTIKNTALYFNQAGVGGAIYISGNSFMNTIVNSTVAQNQADSGGAIFMQGNVQVDVFTSTFAENNAPQGSEISNIGVGTLNLSNSVLVCVSASNSCLFQSGFALTSNIHSIIGIGTLSDFGLTELADHGGPTRTMALVPGSPLIDAGEDLVCAYAPVNNLDQRGATRPRGSHCDIGAYEAQFLIRYVKQNAAGANDGNSWANAYTDLQAALVAASPGDEIWVAAGTYKPTIGTDRTISFTLKNGVAIYGGFAGTEALVSQRDYETNVTVLSGDIGTVGDNSDNSYHVVVGSGTNNSTLLDGLTISLGNASFGSNSGPESAGGGIYIITGGPTLTNIVFSGNVAFYGGGIYIHSGDSRLINVTFNGNEATFAGGGIYNSSSNLALTDVTFSENSANFGSGMANFSSSPILTNVTFSNNLGLNGGGGMYNSSSNPILTNVTFSNNTAPYYGGGIYNESSAPTLTNVTFVGNSGSHGGAVYNRNSNSTIHNAILWNNTAPNGAQIYNDTGSAVISNSVIEGGYEGGTNIITTDPRLGVIAANGGFTETIPLLSGSSAINAGDDVYCPALDQRGVTRPQGRHCDIGAYEYEKKSGNDTTGVFRPSNGALYLKNNNTTGFADIQINYGIGGDYPIVGDWDGDGDVTIGIYRNGSFYLRNENTIGFADVVFPFGLPGDQPIAGDWNGDGVDTIGVYRNGMFYLRNDNSTGTPSASFALGIAGDVGIAGDWDGDGLDTTGVFRPSNGALYLKNTNVTGFADIQINYGLPGDKPVTGDWDNDGVDTIGVYRNGQFMLRNSNTIGFAEIVFDLGIPGDMPIAGNWDGQP